MMSTTYKFYLSFENSLCVDYITEKLWRILYFNVVPVVLGAADYSQFVVCSHDRPNLLACIAGVLSTQGLNILSADFFFTPLRMAVLVTASRLSVQTRKMVLMK